MKKLTLTIFLFLSVFLTVYAQVQVGTGTDKNQKLPFYPAFGYSYTQSIYLGSELNASGTITSIKWYYSGSTKLPNSQQLKIYIGNTTKSVFASASDWEPLNNLTLVYSGTFPITTPVSGWKTINLTTPFVYDGTSNLVIATNENMELGDGFNDRFYNTAVNGIRSLAYWGDSPIDISNPPNAYVDYGGYVAFVPNIIFGGITQGCPNITNINISNITTSSASLNWTATTPAPTSGYDYYYSTSSTTPNSSTIPSGTILSGTTANLTSLLPATTYYTWVRTNCGSGVYSSWSSYKSFVTDCIAVNNFYENFDNSIVPNLPSCWNKILRGPGLSIDAKILTADIGLPVSSPTLVELFNGANASSGEIILVSPNLSNLADGTHQVTFYAHGTDNLQIGTLSSNAIDAVFTLIATVAVKNNLDTNQPWKKFTIDFSTYHGGDHYIGFKLDKSLSTADYPYIDLDNISWETIPSCSEVTGLINLSTTPNSAVVKWNSSNAPNYQVVVGSSTDSNPNNLTPLSPTPNLYQELMDLLPNTTYKVWVRSVCEGNKYGLWSDAITFTTPCLPSSGGFYENFEGVTPPNLPTCWGKIIRGATVSKFCRVETNQYSNILPLPNIDVQLYNDNSKLSDDIILVSPNLSTLPLGTYRLKFDARHDFYAANVQIGTLNDNSVSAVFTPKQLINLTDTTEKYTVEFNNYTGTDTYIGFRLISENTFSTVDLDNISWELSPSCDDVSNITVPSVTDNSATVLWTSGGSEDSWDVAVVLPTETNPDTFSFTNTTIIPTVINNLTANTTYNVWVRSVCFGDVKGAWIGPVSFTTACSPIAAFNENFENAAIPELPSCWGKILRGETLSEFANIETTSDALMPQQTNAVVMRNSDSGQTSDIILVSPNVSTLQLGTYRLKFKAKGEGLLEMGTLSSNTNSAVFNPLGSNNSVSPTFTAKEYIIDFNGYSGTDTFIGIRLTNAKSYSYIELDNIIWEPIPPCPDVNGLKTVETTINTISIEWNQDQSTQWQVAVGNDPNIATPINVDIPNYIITSLSSGTSYNIWVRVKCNENLYGEWSKIVVSTQCQATNTPYLQDFESAITPNLPECTSAYNLSNGPYNWYVDNGPGFGFNSKTLTYNSDLYTDANAWFFTQGINLIGGKNYSISYRYGGASTDIEYYTNNLKVMYGTEPSQSNMTNLIADYVDFAVDQPVSQKIDFTPTTSGVYYFGFDVYSLNNSNYMFIDDILIEENTLATKNFDNNQFSYFPNPVKDVLNISYINDIKSISVYNILGQEVIAKSINGNISKVDMSQLTNGTYLVKISTNDLTTTIKVVKQ